MKVVVSKQKNSRVILENPFNQRPYKQRLIEQNAVNLRNNCIIEDLKNGYCRTKVIDKSKTFK